MGNSRACDDNRGRRGGMLVVRLTDGIMSIIIGSNELVVIVIVARHTQLILHRWCVLLLEGL